MEKTNCGNCNWHDEIKQKRTYCLFYDGWSDINYTCENFVKYSNMNREERSRRASEARERLETKEREEREKQEGERRAQEEQRHAEEIARLNRNHTTELQQTRMTFDKKLWRASWWWQLILVVIGTVLGVVGTIIFKP